MQRNAVRFLEHPITGSSTKELQHMHRDVGKYTTTWSVGPKSIEVIVEMFVHFGRIISQAPLTATTYVTAMSECCMPHWCD
jgi:hypothetical protein